MARLALDLHRHDGLARCGSIAIRGRRFQTPAFMPVGTAGTVKALSPNDLEGLYVQIILSNTYHLLVRPGPDRVRELGGLHRFMGWSGAILTDSGGYQIFSQSEARRARVDDDGATFRSHVDGTEIRLTPESAIDIQDALDPDIAMVLDHFPALPATAAEIGAACARTLRWARRCRDHHRERVASGQALFGIVQGGADLDTRARQAEAIVALEFDGYAIGGLAVGEPRATLHRTIAAAIPLLPADHPRYVMGIGYPEDLLAGIEAGADMFDCVVPTRHARTGQAFTSRGVIRLRRSENRASRAPLDPNCSCETCSGFELGYLTHLYTSNEMLGPILVARHNVHFYQQIMRDAAEAIRSGTFHAYKQHFLSEYGSADGACADP